MLSRAKAGVISIKPRTHENKTMNSRYKNNRTHPVIGLTGPMCAGKNQAGVFLEKKGFYVVDADQIARTALNLIQDKVLTTFSEEAQKKDIELQNPDGSINRKALGELVFKDKKLLKIHENLIYPQINHLLEEEIMTHPDSTVVINAALLHKSPILDRCDFVFFIDAPVLLRFLRAKKRDSHSFCHIYARFSSQKNLFAQYILKKVDILRVQNDRSIQALEKRLETLLSKRGY